MRVDVDPHGNGLGTCEPNLNAATIRRVSAHRFRFFLSLSTRMRLTTSLQKLRFQEHAHWSAVSTVTYKGPRATKLGISEIRPHPIYHDCLHDIVACRPGRSMCPSLLQVLQCPLRRWRALAHAHTHVHTLDIAIVLTQIEALASAALPRYDNLNQLIFQPLLLLRSCIGRSTGVLAKTRAKKSRCYFSPVRCAHREACRVLLFSCQMRS